MTDYKKIKVLDDYIQAQLLDSILTEENIPHLMKSYSDTAYDGLFQMSKGWGHVEAPEEFEDRILDIIDELSEAPPGEEETLI
jgi:hypothetical protein